MKTILNLAGLLLTLGAALVVVRTLLVWRGVLRGGVFMFFLGFISFALGFVWNIFTPASLSADFGLIFFSLGAAFLLWGAKRIFAFSTARR